MEQNILCSPSNPLRRPSSFHQGSPVSNKVMEALLIQKNQGKLSNSALEQWVRKFEKEYEECYISSSVEDDGRDTEAEFEALLKQHQYRENIEENYASKKFDSSVPQHRLLDNSTARNKVKVNHRQSFKDKRNEIQKTTNIRIENQSVPSYSPASPKLSNNLTNFARDSKVTKKVLINDKSLMSPSTRSFPKNESSCDQNEYEDVKVFKKRMKKKNRKEPEMFVSSVKNFEVKYSNSPIEYGSNQIVTPTEEILNNVKEEAPVVSKEPVLVAPKAPFERFQSCLFSLFTLCVPWSCMKKVYWKSHTKKQDSYSSISRRSSKSRR